MQWIELIRLEVGIIRELLLMRHWTFEFHNPIGDWYIPRFWATGLIMVSANS